MSGDNVIELAERRAKADEQVASSRRAEREVERSREALALLTKLRQMKRVPRGDRPKLVANFGRLVEAIDHGNRLHVAERVLKNHTYQKRKRYLRFSDEDPEVAPHAAAGSEFAKIIEAIVDEHVERRADRTQAIIATVFRALKGTSFLPNNRLHEAASGDASDVVAFATAVEQVMTSFSQQAELGEYFEFVSKYPLYPEGSWPEKSYPRNEYLELQSDREPNDLTRWERSLEDEELSFVPWWAPKCVIGHLYVPFYCTPLTLTAAGVAELKEICGGKLTPDTFRHHECSRYVDPFEGATRGGVRRFWHRLPIWLVTLPSRQRFVPCLLASVSLRDDFQVNRSVVDESYDFNEDLITPCFVGSVGQTFDDDSVYFCGDAYSDPPSYHVRITESEVRVIGPEVDDDIANFIAEGSYAVTSDDLPPWLDPHPVQMLLPLTMESDIARAFCLAPRVLAKDLKYRSYTWGVSDSETIFRPALSDPIGLYTQLRHNTIAAYLLRNFVDAERSTIVEALKNDARLKDTMGRQLVDAELAKTRASLDDRYRT